MYSLTPQVEDGELVLKQPPQIAKKLGKHSVDRFFLPFSLVLLYFIHFHFFQSYSFHGVLIGTFSPVADYLGKYVSGHELWQRI